MGQHDRASVGVRRLAKQALLAAAVALLAIVPPGTGVAAAGVPALALPPLALPPLPAPPGSEDAFYTPPSPLPAGRPGDVLKVRTILTSPYPEARTQQIMYLSTDNHGTLIPVTGLLLTPLIRASGDHNPLVVHTPGTRGLADHCAPSKQANLLQANPGSPEYSTAEYRQFLLQGISVVVTDYDGQGTPGLPSYLVSRVEGQNGLDALRAAQRVRGSGVSADSPVGVTGYSQGGQGAAATAELQPTYAPELHLVGVLAGGVPTDMSTEVNHLNGNPTAGAGFALAALIGLDHANPELDLQSRLTAEGKQVMERVEGSCVVELLAAFGTTTTGDVTEPDVLADPEWQARLADSLLGTTAPGAPAYIYHGTIDTIVPFAQGEKLYHDWCARGASVQFEALIGLDHVTGGAAGPPRGVQWLVDRLHGAATPEGCREVGLL